MNSNITDYILNARKAGASDEKIKSELTASGWPPAEIDRLLTNDGLPPAPTYVEAHNLVPQAAATAQPISVVENLSTRGLEYNIMFLALTIAALALGSILQIAVTQAFSADSDWSGFYTYAGSALIVSAPIFIILFWRLKTAELRDPKIRLDSSRKKGVQSMLVISFLVGVGNIIGYVFGILNGDSQISENTAHLLVTLLIAGGIFTYYWIDEHRKVV